MDFFDVIRGFFGLPYRNDGIRNQPGFRNPIMGEDSDDDDEISDDDYRFNNRQNPFGFNIFSGDILEMHRFFEQQFDEIMRNFQSNWTFAGIEGPEKVPGIEQPDQFDDNPRSKFVKPEYLEPLPNPKPHIDRHSIESSPRHRFLRPAYVEPPVDPEEKKDTDIDNKLDPSQVLDIFPDKNTGNKQIESYSSRKQSHFSSQVIMKRMLPNGGVEEERKRLTDGMEEVCVSRQLGDMKHITTTIKHPDGTTEKKEEFINFDEDKLPDFNKAWGTSTSGSSKNFEKFNKTAEIMIPEKFSLFDIFTKFIP